MPAHPVSYPGFDLLLPRGQEEEPARCLHGVSIHSNRKQHQLCAHHSDTLFLAGCGRFFEGTPKEMHAALTHLGKLPDDTVVYNGHEYTKGSAKFGLSIEPNNEALKG